MPTQQWMCDTCGLVNGVDPQHRLQPNKCVACGTEGGQYALVMVAYLVPVRMGYCVQCSNPAEYVPVEDGDDGMCSVHAAQAASEGIAITPIEEV